MDYIQKYADFLREHLNVDSKLKVVFDPSNGATAPILKKLFENVENIEVYFINDELDGNFPGHGPNPTLQGATDELEEKVIEVGADIGAIFDADGDRVLFINEKGVKIEAVDTLLLLSQQFKGPYIIDVTIGETPMSWISPDKEFIESKTGTYFLKESVETHKAEFGAESSSHYYFRDFFNSDSGIFATVSMLNQVSLLKEQGSSLSKWNSSLPKSYRSGEINLEVKNKEGAVNAIKEYFLSNNASISTLDGVSVEGQDYWANVRISNTEPIIRINIAAKNVQKLEEIKEIVLQIVQ